MTLTPEQQLVVEQNMGLVGKVIKDKVHGLGQGTAFAYEDLFQIGCIGLCKAAATDKGGCFSTYAYRLIWNEICDALIKATWISSHEYGREHSEHLQPLLEDEAPDVFYLSDLKIMMEQVQARACGTVAKGIRCLELQAEGYDSKEIGKRLGENPATVRLWMTRGRRFLREQPEFKQYIKEVTA